MDKKWESVQVADSTIPVTEAWDEISFEELEERLELDGCKMHCNKNNNI